MVRRRGIRSCARELRACLEDEGGFDRALELLPELLDLVDELGGGAVQKPEPKTAKGRVPCSRCGRLFLRTSEHVHACLDCLAPARQRIKAKASQRVPEVEDPDVDKPDLAVAGVERPE